MRFSPRVQKTAVRSLTGSGRWLFWGSAPAAGLGLGLVALVGPLLLGCSDPAEPAPPAPAAPFDLRTQAAPLSPAFVNRALRALSDRLPADAKILEIRATHVAVEIQIVEDDAVQSLRYREQAPPKKKGDAAGAPEARAAQLVSPLPIIDPKITVPTFGDGNLLENAFPASEAEVGHILEAFPVAIQAVDPTDGWVRELVVRRYLPFGHGVRARIFVESPRMSGSIDTNGKGMVLK